MTVSSAFIVYLTVFRLSIVAAGVISIVLGYRLFCKGVFPESGTMKNTTLDAKIGENRFTLSNAAPGTFFALFGVVIISVMFASGGPEMTLKMINQAAQSQDGSVVEGKGDQMMLALRGDSECALAAATKKGRDYEARGDIDKAMEYYREGVKQIALPMNYLAWLYHSKGEQDKALPLATIAVNLLPDDANCLDTLAEISFDEGRYAEALLLMEKAAEIDSRFSDKLERFRERAIR